MEYLFVKNLIFQGVIQRRCAVELVQGSILEILLLTIVFSGLLVEIKTGGLGVGALLAFVAAAIFFGSRYMNGLVAIYPIAAFLGGVLCLVIEMLSPTVGLLAGLGVAAMLYSIVLTLGGDVGALYALLAAMALSLLVFVVLLRYLPSSRLWNKVILRDASTAERGYVSAVTPLDLVGRRGWAETDLRPSGAVSFGDAPVDVVSEGGYIPRGSAVIVVAAQGSRIVVRPVPPLKEA